MIKEVKKKKLENFIVYMNDLLGEGSFGRVYRGFDDKLKEPVAVKVLDKRHVDEDETLRNAVFLQIKIMKKFNSRYIVKIIDVLETQHNYYIVEELCNGKDLKETIKREGKFAEEKALRHLKEICTGFIQLICHGVIHRDVKPQNILMHDGAVKIGDFGFAKSVISNNQLHNTIVGTPLYMSPQQLQASKYTSKCDIWAIGLIYFEMLYGTTPWTARSEYELLQNITKIPLAFPLTTSISPLSQSFIKGCLGIDQSQRFSWLDLYSHGLFGSVFHEYIEKIKKFNVRAKYALTKIRISVNSHNFNVPQIVDKMGWDLQDLINFQSFDKFIKKLYPAIDIDEQRYIFDNLDDGGKGIILVRDLLQVMEENNINMVDQAKMLKRASFNYCERSDPFAKQKITMKVNATLQRLKQRLLAKNYDLREVYRAYDLNKDEKLEPKQLFKLMAKIDNELSEEQLDTIFMHFDKNKDGSVSFKQFQQSIKNLQ